MHLVDEQDDIAFGLFDLVQNTFQPFFKLAAIFGAGNQAAHIERHQLAVLQGIGNVAIGDAQCEALSDCGFSDTGFADQHGVVFGTAGKDLDGTADFLVTADHRVQLACARYLGQVAGEFLQRVIAILCA